MSQSIRMGRAAARLSAAIQNAIAATAYPLRSAMIEQLESRRLLAAGALDPGWDGDGAAFHNHSGYSADDANAIAIQSDGKVVIAGATGSGSSYGDFVLLRYNTDGSLDSRFDVDGKVVTDFGSVNAGINAMAIQADGKIVVGGRINAASTWDWIVARYNTDGSLDTTFDGDGYLTKDFFGLGYGDELYAISIQPDGKIVATGTAQGPSTSEMATIRLNANGSFDTTFDGDGIAYMDFYGGVDYASDVIAQSDGKILVVGGSVPPGSHRRFVLVRYNNNGTLDTTFDTDGKAETNFGVSAFGRQVARQSDGKYVVGGLVGGSGTSMNWAVARYNTNGSIDTTFGVGGTSSVPGSTVIDMRGHTFVSYGIAVQSDDKVLFGGYAQDPASTTTTYFGLARFTSSGALDTTFDTDGKVTTDASLLYGGGISGTGSGTDLAIAADGKILMTGGAYTSGTTTSDFTTLRYLNDEPADVSAVYDWDETPLQSIDLVRGTTGVFVALDNTDDGTFSIPLGANTFNFYGTSYTGSGQLIVSANGLITFGPVITASYQNSDLSTSPTERAIAPVWDDWAVDRTVADEVLYRLDTAGNRLIIEWVVHPYSGGSSTATFQAILELNTGAAPGDIYFNYPDLDVGSSTMNNGGTATVGIKNAEPGTDELLINFNNSTFPYVQSGTAIRVFSGDSEPPPTGNGSISGQVFEDRDGDNDFDVAEPALSGITVFIDANENNTLDAGETSTVTAGDGSYSFTGLTAGEYNIKEVVPGGYISTMGATGVFTNDDSHFENVDRALFPTLFTGTASGDQYTLRLNAADTRPAGTHIEILVDGVVTYTKHKSNFSRLDFRPGAGNDTLTIDYTNGSPVPFAGVWYGGGTESTSTGDRLINTGGSAGETFDVYANAVVRNGVDQVFFDPEIEHIAAHSMGGADTITQRGILDNMPTEIHAADGNDTINLWANDVTSPTTVIGSLGNDTINLGNSSNSITSLTGPITLIGDSGADAVFINDSGSTSGAAYTITSNTFDRSTLFGLLIYSTIESLTLTAQPTANSITVNSTDAAVAYTINAGSGNDSISLAGGAPGTVMQINGENDNDTLTVGSFAGGAIGFNGGTGTDAAVFNGTSGFDSIDITNGSVASSAKTLTYTAGAAPETITVNALGGNDVVNVLFNPAGTQLNINGGTDIDRINIAPEFTTTGSRNVDNVDGPVAVNGGGQLGDMLNYNDRDNPTVGTTYNITHSTVTRAGAGIVSFSFISTFNFNSPERTALIYATGSLAGMQTNINLYTGNQYVQLGNDLNFFAGPVAVYDYGTDAGNFDTVWLADVVSASDPYTITTGQVTRPFFGGLSYGHIESLVIDGQNGNNTFTIDSVGFGTTLEIHGNGGSDNFIVNHELSGNMDLQGGFGAANVDTLTVNATNQTTMGISPTSLTQSARTAEYSGLEALALNLGGFNDAINLTGTAAGTPVTINGGNGNDLLNVNGAPSSPVTFNGGLDPAFTDTINLNAGTFTFNADAIAGTANLLLNVYGSGSAAVFNATQHLAGLTVSSGGVANMPTHGDRYLFTRGLSIGPNSRLELADNDLIWDYTGDSPFLTARGYVVTGRNTGTGGITSSTSIGKTVLAVVDNAVYGRTSFNGEEIDSTTLIGKYTYYGDSNLDGKVTGDDYVAIDSNLGRNPGTSQWFQGDFNFDGYVTGDDYVSVDANLGLGTVDPAAYDEEQAEMITIHAERYGGKKYVKMVEEAAEERGKDRPKKRADVRKSAPRTR